MNQPEPFVYKELLEHFNEVSANAKTLGRLETLLEISKLLQVMADSSKSVIEIRTLNKVIERLENI